MSWSIVLLDRISVKKSSEANYTVLNDTNLIRQMDATTARVDLLGLVEDIYQIKVTNSEGLYQEYANISVASYDQSGYAHYGNENESRNDGFI